MSRREGNFDCLRLIAAMMVMFGHSYDITDRPGAPGPLWIWSHGQVELASLALLIFFTISGYLVTGSFVASRSAWRFCAARFLRLAPGLFAAVLLQSLVLGPMVSTLTLGHYFSDMRLYLSILGNMTLLSMNGPLPGVFVSNPWADAMNVPLWTLPYETACYGFVLAFGLTGLLRARILVPLFVACVLMRYFWLRGPLLVFGTAFLAGAVLYTSRLPLLGWAAILCGAGLAFGIFVTGFRVAYPVCGTYLLIYLARSPNVRLPNLSRWGDLSYGVYIYAWPVQQSVVWLFPGTGAALNVGLSLPIVLMLAWLSWHLIEKRALARKPPVPSSNMPRVAN